MKNYLIVFCLLFLSSKLYSQGKIDGFYREKGNAAVVFGLGFEDSKDYFAGTNKTGLTRSLYYANIYGAYGITNDFDVSLSLPYMSSNKNSDLQDMSLFLKYRVYKTELVNGKLQLSLAGGFSTPVGNYTTGGLNDLGQRATIIEGRAVIHYHWHTGWFAKQVRRYQNGIMISIMTTNIPLVGLTIVVLRLRKTLRNSGVIFIKLELLYIGLLTVIGEPI
jgi:hypothetical protein